MHVDELKHYGVKGMKWGVRKDRGGAPRSTVRRAKKDANEYAKAKMFYGEGAGTRRKLIKAKVEQNSKRDPAYKKAFDEAMSGQDMAKRASQARGARGRKDAQNAVVKTAKGINHVIRGNSQYASTAAVAAVAAGSMWYKNGGKRQIEYQLYKAQNSQSFKTAKSMGSDFLKSKGFG